MQQPNHQQYQYQQQQQQQYVTGAAGGVPQQPQQQQMRQQQPQYQQQQPQQQFYQQQPQQMPQQQFQQQQQVQQQPQPQQQQMPQQPPQYQQQPPQPPQQQQQQQQPPVSPTYNNAGNTTANIRGNVRAVVGKYNLAAHAGTPPSDADHYGDTTADATASAQPRRHRCHVVGMVHVHCTTALLNHTSAGSWHTAPLTQGDVLAANELIAELSLSLDELKRKFPVLFQVVGGDALRLRSVVLLFLNHVSNRANAQELLARFQRLDWVQQLVQRASRDVAVYVAHGVPYVEIENIAAPYFIGAGACPWEEILALNFVCAQVRRDHPELGLGVHILSANELEVLPLAVLHGAAFVRSEATLFHGTRPEGEVGNSGNLARFMYLRQHLRLLLNSAMDDMTWPRIWSDVQKKHTVFPAELADLGVWLHNATFMKLEGVIVTGQETGSNASEADLRRARESIDAAARWAVNTLPGVSSHENPIHIPLVTGSGSDFGMYGRYADFMIVGSQFKQYRFWENDVDERNVGSTIENMKAEIPNLHLLPPPQQDQQDQKRQDSALQDGGGSNGSIGAAAASGQTATTTMTDSGV